MSNNKCDDCESKNIGYINNDCLCLECGEKINIKKASEVTRQEADKIAIKQRR